MVVSNSSPLIYLAALSDFAMLHALFPALTIPEAVHRELVAHGPKYPVFAAAQQAEREGWLQVVSLPEPSRRDRIMREYGLHIGESEAIVLALQTQPDAVLMDDQQAVQCARSQGLNVIRTPALYYRAKQQGLIQAIRPKLDALRASGFWLRDEHYRKILRQAGEA